jgi:hypothetical protein
MHIYLSGIVSLGLVESSTPTELILKDRFMLWILGIALDRPKLILVENLSMSSNNFVPLNALIKKHIRTVSRQDHGAAAVNIRRFAYMKSEENVSDVLIKPMSNEKCHYLMKK